MANGTIPTNTFTTVSYNLIALIGVAFLSYLAIFTGVNAAKQFGVSPMLGGMIGTASTNAAISTIATTLGWVNEEVAAKSILAPNAGGIIGVVVGVWVLAQVEKRIHKIMPSALDITFTPLLSMLIVMPIFVLMVMPITGIVSVAISNFLNMFIMSDNIVVSIITGYLMAALFLPLVLFGLHRGLTPLYTLQIEAYGGTSLY
jgi:PTS system sucrose-specific IIC component